MINTGRQPGPTAQVGDLLVCQFETQEMHGRGLVVVTALEILIRYWTNLVAVADLEPDAPGSRMAVSSGSKT